MAEHQIEARILLRYDTYSAWMTSTVILKEGEAAIASFPYGNTIIPTDTSTQGNLPAIGIKIGDGHHYFYELPWVQAIAADVYSWAKEAEKPEYSAEEIYGLQDYVQTLIDDSGSGSTTVVPRIYSLTHGTGVNANKYYLQYKNADESNSWIVDTSQYIDLSDLVTILNWISREDLQHFGSLGDRTEEHIQYDLGQLQVVDEEISPYVVTSVSQTNGKISTTKQVLNFSDLNGSVTVDKGGTGRVNLTENYVLVGNNTDPVKLIPIADSIANEYSLVPNYIIKQYIDGIAAGLTGAMHFIGEASSSPLSSTDAGITNYLPAIGDVILWEQKEYVWNGSNWILLGDEGSYAVKGSITNNDIAENAMININKINNLSNLLNTKVDKEQGKTLTSNDFTTGYKNKLDGIQDQAQRNFIEHIYINDVEVSPKTIDDGSGAVEKVVSFRMSSLTEDEAEQLRQTSEKVQTIETNAQVNIIESISIDGDKQTPDSEKNVNIALAPYTNVIESISLNNGSPLSVVNKNVNINLDESALAFEVITGAEVPGNTANDRQVNIINKKLQLARISKTGSIYDITNLNNRYVITTPAAEQDQEDYIILNCGTAQKLIDNFSILNN